MTDAAPDAPVAPGSFFRISSPPLNIPDSGTVWECGFADGVGTPCVGFHTKPGKFNAMLTEPMRGVIMGWEELERIIKAWDPRTDFYWHLGRNVKGWEGETQ